MQLMFFLKLVVNIYIYIYIYILILEYVIKDKGPNCHKIATLLCKQPDPPHRIRPP